MTLSITAATNDDAPLIASLVTTAFGEYRDALVPASGALKESPESVLGTLESPGGGAFLAFVGAEPAGCVLFHDDGEDLYFGRLSVLARHRGTGIARALLAAVEHHARLHGYPGVTLGVRLALASNRALFASSGYEEVSYGTHPGFDAPTWANMRKRLA